MRMRSPRAAAAALLLAVACDANAPEGSSELELAGPSGPFGAVPIGAHGPSRRFTLTNGGDARTGALLVQLTGDHAGEFAIIRDDCSGQALPVAAACNIDVQFRPVTAGPKEAQLAVTDNVGRAVSASLDGSGAAGAISLTPAVHDFGTAGLGTASPEFRFTVSSAALVGAGPLQAVLFGPQAGQFQIGVDGCTGQLVSPGSPCTVGVRFLPSEVGASTAKLIVRASTGDSASSTLHGLAGAPGSLAASPSTHDFGLVAANAAPNPVTVTITNQLSAQSAHLSASLTGTHPAAYAISDDQCSDRDLAPGESCTLQVAFLMLEGQYNAQLVVSESFGATASVSLAATGVQTTLTASPTNLFFGSVIVGATSAARTVTVHNAGATPSIPLQAQVLECDYWYYYGCTPSTTFLVENDGCASGVAPGASCEIMVAFRPGYIGTHYNVLTVGSLQVSLQGDGSGLGLSSDMIQFPLTSPGGSSGPVTVIVSNNSPSPTGPLSVAALVSGFTLASDGCTGQTLAPGAYCIVGVTFAPTNPGSHIGQLVVSASLGGSAAASLQGEAGP